MWTYRPAAETASRPFLMDLRQFDLFCSPLNKMFNIRDIFDVSIHSDQARLGLQGEPWFCLSVRQNKGARGQ